VGAQCILVDLPYKGKIRSSVPTTAKKEMKEKRGKEKKEKKKSHSSS